jgi:Effector protein
VRNDPLNGSDPTGEEIRIEGSDEFRALVEQSIGQVRQGAENEAWVSGIEQSRQIVTIVESTDVNSTLTPEAAERGIPSDVTVEFNPSLTRSPTGEGRPAFVGLAHELGHAEEGIKGEAKPPVAPEDIAPGTTPPREENAIRRENMVRAEHGLPERQSYTPRENRRDGRRGSRLRR